MKFARAKALYEERRAREPLRAYTQDEVSEAAIYFACLAAREFGEDPDVVVMSLEVTRAPGAVSLCWFLDDLAEPATGEKIAQWAAASLRASALPIGVTLHWTCFVGPEPLSRALLGQWFVGFRRYGLGGG